MVTCLPVIQEVLQGFSEERAFSTARVALHALPTVESPLRVLKQNIYADRLISTRPDVML